MKNPRVLLLTIALWVPALAGYADESIEGDGRTVDVHVPASYSPSNPAAVVMLLHGFGGSGRQMERYMRFERLADEEGFLYLHPNGSRRRGRRYWAATDACCNLRPGSQADGAEKTGFGIHDPAFAHAVYPVRRHS